MEKFNSLSPRQQALIKNSTAILIICIIISSIYDHQQAVEQNKDTSFTAIDIISFPITATMRFFYRIFSWLFNFFYGLFTRFGVAGEDFNRFIRSAGGIFVFLFKQIFEFLLSIFEFIETILTAPIQIILNFSQFVEKFLRSFSQIFIMLYRILMAILRPIWDLVKGLMPYLLKVLRLPLTMFSKLGLFAKDLAKSILKATKKTAMIVMDALIRIMRQLSHLSFSVLFDFIKIPIMWLIDFLKMLYSKFSLLPFIRKVLHVLMRLPYYIYRAIVDLSKLIYNRVSEFIIYIIEMGGEMLNDIIEMLRITKYLPEFLHPIVAFFSEIGKYLLNLFLKIIVLPYRFVLFIFDVLRHPIQTILDSIYSLIETIREILVALVHIFESGLFQFILNVIQAPYNLLKKLMQKISFRYFLDIFHIPIHLLNYFTKGLKYLVNGIINGLISIAKSVVSAVADILSLLRYFSLQKLIHYLLSPIRFIMRVLEDLSKIPIMGTVVRLLRIILYTPVWLVSFIFRFVYFFLESFMNFFSKNFTLSNIFDMWDNVCWPRDAEYCKQMLEEQNNNVNNGAFGNDYNNYY